MFITNFPMNRMKNVNNVHKDILMINVDKHSMQLYLYFHHGGYYMLCIFPSMIKVITYFFQLKMTNFCSWS